MRPRYHEVADVLRERIISGALPPACPLPSEAQIVASSGVSRPTVRAAVAVLVAEGLVVTLPGRGSFVRRSDDRPSVTYLRAIGAQAGAGLAFTDATLDDPRWRPVEEPRTYRTDATAEIALGLGLAEREPVVVTDRLIADVADRRQSHQLHVPVKVLRMFGWDDSQSAQPGRLYALLDEAGERLRWTEQVRARMPSSVDAELLRMVGGTPLLRIRRTTFTERRGPLLLEDTRMSADDAQLAYELDLDS